MNYKSGFVSAQAIRLQPKLIIGDQKDEVCLHLLHLMSEQALHYHYAILDSFKGRKIILIHFLQYESVSFFTLKIITKFEKWVENYRNFRMCTDRKKELQLLLTDVIEKRIIAQIEFPFAYK